MSRSVLGGLAVALVLGLGPLAAPAQTLQQNNEAMFRQMQEVRGRSSSARR